MTRDWIIDKAIEENQWYMPEDMTLDQAMFELTEDEDCIIHIGAESNYFFIGDYDEYKAMIDDITAKYKQKIRYTLHNNEQDLYEHANRQLKKEARDIEGKLVREAETVDEYFNRLARLKKRYEKNLKRYENYIPLNERKVKRIYALSTCKGVAVIIEGHEIGDFWDLEEWQKVHKKKEVA